MRPTVLDTLTPAERLAFVLHDTFAVPFEEIAPILERSPVAARQRAVVDAFLAASRDIELLGDPEHQALLDLVLP